MTTTAEVEAAAYRLPQEVVPRRYDLTLAPDIANARFSGDEIVTIEVRQPVRTITLNAIELEIQHAEIERDGSTPIVGEVSLDSELEPRHTSLRRGDPCRHLAAEAWFYRHAQRQAARLLPQQLQGRRRVRSAWWPPRSSRRPTPAAPSPAGTSRRSRPSSPPRWSSTEALHAISNAADQSTRAQPASGKRKVVLRRHDPDVDLPGRLHRRRVRGDASRSGVDGTPLRVWCVPGKRT